MMIQCCSFVRGSRRTASKTATSIRQRRLLTALFLNLALVHLVHLSYLTDHPLLYIEFIALSFDFLPFAANCLV